MDTVVNYPKADCELYFMYVDESQDNVGSYSCFPNDLQCP